MIPLPLFLIGPMAAGKSHVGSRLANTLGVGFVDLDIFLESQEGRSIAAIFAEAGEAYFRQAEARVLQQVASLGNGVIATGGGCICLPETRTWLKTQRGVIYLKASPSIQAQRLVAQGQDTCIRPLLGPALQNPSALLHRLEQLTDERRSWYQACARYTIDTNHRSPAEVVEAILQPLRKHSNY